MPAALQLGTKRGAKRHSNNNRASHYSAYLSVGLSCLASGVVGFYAGFLVASSSSAAAAANTHTDATTSARVNQQHRAVAPDDTAPRFPPTVPLVGLAVTDRDDFMAQFDTGVPRDPSTADNSQVLLLYQSEAALPSHDAYASQEATHLTTVPFLEDSVQATANCDYLKVILTDHNPQRRQCMAIVGQYEAFHIQKFMRLPQHGKLDSTLPLRYVNRGAQESGRKSTQPADPDDTKKYWGILTTYLDNLDAVLQQLKPVLEQVATADNTVTVLVCNYGQSELLLNFICSCRHRGLDLSHVLVFATDEETRDLVQAAGVHVFYDEINYGDMPKKAAGRYADKTFSEYILLWSSDVVMRANSIVVVAKMNHPSRLPHQRLFLLY